jgi:hypothetical protein
MIFNVSGAKKGGTRYIYCDDSWIMCMDSKKRNNLNEFFIYANYTTIVSDYINVRGIFVGCTVQGSLANATCTSCNFVSIKQWMTETITISNSHVKSNEDSIVKSGGVLTISNSTLNGDIVVESGGTLYTNNITHLSGTITVQSGGTWINDGALYDNRDSGISANNVQSAIDELAQYRTRYVKIGQIEYRDLNEMGSSATLNIDFIGAKKEGELFKSGFIRVKEAFKNGAYYHYAYTDIISINSVSVLKKATTEKPDDGYNVADVRATLSLSDVNNQDWYEGSMDVYIEVTDYPGI